MDGWQVVGVRDQVDERISKAGGSPVYHNGMRVTDHSMLKILKEELGAARFEVESALARGFRGMTTRVSECCPRDDKAPCNAILVR